MLLRGGADPNIEADLGDKVVTPLDCAVQCRVIPGLNVPATVHELLLAMADPEGAEGLGGPLVCAARRGDKACVAVLLQGKARVDTVGYDPRVPSPAAGMLIDRLCRSRTECEDTRGWTALHAAVWACRDLKLLLEDLTCDVEQRTTAGETALALAVRRLLIAREAGLAKPGSRRATAHQ